jgi:hypothetical protein
MSARYTLYGTLIHATVVVSAIAAVTALGMQGTIDGQSVVAVLAAAIGFAGANATSVSSLGAVVNGKSIVTPQLIAEQGATARTGMVAAGLSEAHVVHPETPTSEAEREESRGA